MLENLLKFYRKSDSATKRRSWLHLSEKLVLENGKVAILSFTEPIQLILRISEVLGSLKKRKRSKMTSCLVGYVNVSHGKLT